MKKGIVICRIAFAFGVVLYLTILIALAVTTENWNETVSSVLRMINEVSRIFVITSQVVWAILSYRIKEQKKEERIKDLEQEVRQLNRK